MANTGSTSGGGANGGGAGASASNSGGDAGANSSAADAGANNSGGEAKSRGNRTRVRAPSETPTPERPRPSEASMPAAPPASSEAKLPKEKKPRKARRLPQEAEQGAIEAMTEAERQQAIPKGEMMPLAIDDQVRADIQRLAGIRARDRAEAQRVLDATRTKTVEPDQSTETQKPAAKQRRALLPADVEEPPPRAVPKEVADAFVQVGNRWFDREDTKTVAFVDRGTKLETASQSPAVARALVAIAEERNEWRGIKISKGSTEFRREVYIEATARGIPVVGYNVTKADLAEVQARVERYAGRNGIESMTARADEFRKLPPQEAARRPDLASAAVAADALARISANVRDPKLRERLQAGFREQVAQGMERGDQPRALDDPKVGARVTVPEGIYISSGRAPFNHDPLEKENFYVKYQRADGTIRERWGKELEDAIATAKASPGDTIRLVRGKAHAVTVTGNLRDENNRVIGQQAIDAKRNEWKVEVLARRQDRELQSPERTPRSR